MKYTCPRCGGNKVLLTDIQLIVANTGDHYCHSMKSQDPDSVSQCLDCDWEGEHRQLIQENI